ncbi:MAG: hypothetical protein IIA03_10350, partial [Proteobacteria bacterium]|nr:hypothetical protein [Pseudomonadota bacterium]
MGFTGPAAFALQALNASTDQVIVRQATAADTVNITGTLGTAAVFVTAAGVRTGQVGYATTALLGLTAIDITAKTLAAAPAAANPTFMRTADTVAFTFTDPTAGGNVNIGVAPRDGSLAGVALTAGTAQLPAENAPTTAWGFPGVILGTVGATEAGDLLFLSNRDATKNAAAQTHWDLY